MIDQHLTQPIAEIQRWMTQSLWAMQGGFKLAEIIVTALKAVDPEMAIKRTLQCNQRTITIGAHQWQLAAHGRVIVVGAGKAGAPMAYAADHVLGALIDQGLVVVKDGHADRAQVGRIHIREARHPLPDNRGVQAAREIARLVQNTTSDDLVLVLISGGGSALLTAPVAGISLADLQKTTDLLLQAGAPISALNAVRKHCEQLKGGQLAARTPAPIAGLIISDVVYSPLDVIASGPTTPDSTTYADALHVLEQYNIRERVPESVIVHLAAGTIGDKPETPKPQAPIWQRVQNTLIARNTDAVQAAAQAARASGFEVHMLSEPVQGEARVAGRQLAQQLKHLAAQTSKPLMLIGGGETTVTVRGGEAARAGGGRNQELALAAAQELAGAEHLALLAVATDGGDGPTDAAGAVATGHTIAQATEQGLDAAAALATNTSYAFWRTLEDALRPGPTCTNVNDLVLGVSWGHSS